MSLERGNAGEKFKLRVRQDDYASNLSLEAFLDRTQGIKLPVFEAGEAFDPTVYFREVADAVSAKTGWEVIHDDIVLGFFSFAKFLMYRDLDPGNWPKAGRITDRPLVKGLLSDGFASGGDMIPEDANIDPFIPPAEMLHILDSDSSQALTVHEARRGKDMVIQGPPGTGKSQTIANIIASAVADGKTVLFVAEKMAALEVVKRRLDATGVGDACLELHSSKANKRALLEELRRTWELGAPRGQGPGTLHARLLAARDRLNDHAVRMHEAHAAAGLTPYQVIGQLSRLKLDGEKPSDIALSDPEHWSADDFAERHDVIGELVERIEAIGRPDAHIWRGVGLSSILPNDVERMTTRIERLAQSVDAFVTDAGILADLIEMPQPAYLAALDPLVVTSRRIAGAPNLEGAALGNEVWTDRVEHIDDLLATGTAFAALRERLSSLFTSAGWGTDLGEPIAALENLPLSFPAAGFGRIGEVADRLPRLMVEAGGLARSLARDIPVRLADIDAMVCVGEKVAAAPDADPEAFAADLWDNGVERAGDVAVAVAALEAAKARIAGGLTEAAWDMDLSAARGTLASHGTGFFRLFSSEWRRANRLVRSILTRPDEPLEETLAILDALSSGQGARRTIESETSFAAVAFGQDWRGDRSSAAPLNALVEWMRSLKGLGAEPRMIASRRPDRADIEERAARTRSSAEKSAAVMIAMWNDLEDQRVVAFGEADSPKKADLTALLAVSTRIHHADVATAAIMEETPDALDERMERLRDLTKAQAASAALADGAPLGRAAFGDAWIDLSSDWGLFVDAASWIESNSDIRLLASRIEQREQPALLAVRLEEQRSDLISELGLIFEHLRLDVGYALGASAAPNVDLARLSKHLGQWASAGEQLFQWVGYRDRAERGKELGCGDVVARLSDGRLTTEGAIPAFEMAYYEAVYADQVASSPELGRFDGTLHGRLAREFAEMDRQRIASASFEVVSAHHQRVPARDGGAVGPLGVLRAEIARKRGHMPIRKLMETAGPAVQALKPVIMMSPLSVAQFLAPGVFDFDLLVMDEASQIQPVDALGAVARAKQVVVVGDPKQLPPTAFFSKMTSGTEDDEDAAGRVADIESILGLFTARGLPMRMLRWHYRSKHQSLIAVSNRQFYENKLFIVPSVDFR